MTPVIDTAEAPPLGSRSWRTPTTSGLSMVDRLESRAVALAHGLAGIGANHSSEVIVTCCDDHSADGHVAERSAQILRAAVGPVDGTSRELETVLRRLCIA